MPTDKKKKKVRKKKKKEKKKAKKKKTYVSQNHEPFAYFHPPFRPYSMVHSRSEYGRREQQQRHCHANVHLSEIRGVRRNGELLRQWGRRSRVCSHGVGKIAVELMLHSIKLVFHPT